MKKKILIPLLALLLVLGCAVGGTLAWLLDETGPVKNEFTISNINIELTETKTDFQMVPGWTIDKDPKVTVKANSEDCWLFIKVEEGFSSTQSTNLFGDFVVYAIDSGWTKGDGTKIPGNVYYRKVTKSTTDQSFEILGAGSYKDKMGQTTTMSGAKDESVTVSWTANQVGVRPSVTKEMMEALSGSKPTLTFTAYAAQLYKTNKPASGDPSNAEFTAAEAWKIASANQSATTNP